MIADYKKEKISEMSELSFQTRSKKIPDYQVQNALLGLYDNNELSRIRRLCNNFRVEFYRLKTEITKAKTIEEIDEICKNHNFNKIV